MNNVKTIIFDFDGTIADTIDIFFSIINEKLAPQFGYAPLNSDELSHIRNAHPREVLKKYGFSALKLPLLVLKARAELAKSIDSVNIQQGIKQVLIQIKEQGIHCGLLTSNSRSNVVRFLRNHGLSSIFDFVYTGKHLFGKDHILRRVLRKRKLNRETTVYIGDEVRDIEAARLVGIRVAAVTWGYNNKNVLKAKEPDWLISDSKKLLAALT